MRQTYWSYFITCMMADKSNWHSSTRRSGEHKILAPVQRLISTLNQSQLHLDLLSPCREYGKCEPKIKVQSRRLGSRAPHGCNFEALQDQAFIQSYLQNHPCTTCVTRGENSAEASFLTTLKISRPAFLLMPFLTVFAYHCFEERLDDYPKFTTPPPSSPLFKLWGYILTVDLCTTIILPALQF